MSICTMAPVIEGKRKLAVHDSTMKVLDTMRLRTRSKAFWLVSSTNR